MATRFSYLFVWAQNTDFPDHKKTKITPSSINNLFSPALLSAPSGSGWHISSLEPQTGAKDEPNLLTHLSPCFSALVCPTPRVSPFASLRILPTHTRAYTYTCSEARLSESGSSWRQEDGWERLGEIASSVSSVTSCCVMVTVGFWFCSV